MKVYALIPKSHVTEEVSLMNIVKIQLRNSLIGDYEKKKEKQRNPT